VACMNEILSFRSPSQFRKWLAKNHRQSSGMSLMGVAGLRLDEIVRQMV